MKRVAVVAAALSIASSASPARASGFASQRFGGEHGNVTESNPTALYYNPGAIGLSEGTSLFGDGTLALRHATWSHAKSAHDVAEPPGAEGANFGRATLTNAFGAPSLGVTTRLGSFAIGAGVFVPFGGRSSWDKNDRFAGSAFPLAVDGVQRWHGYEGALTFLYATAGAAYRIGPLSVGASGNLVFSSVHTKQAKNLALGDDDVTQESRSELDVSGRHGSFGAGVLWEAIAGRLWIGASYQVAPGIGAMKLSGTLTSTSNGVARSDDVELTQHLPDVARVGVRFRPVSSLEIRVFGDHTRWSSMIEQCVALAGKSCGINPDGTAAPGTGTVVDAYRGWQDTVGARAGASAWITPRVEASASVGFETSAIPDATLDPNLPDAATIAPSLGGRFEILDRLYLAITYTHIQYLVRDNTGKSILDDPNVAPTTRRTDGGGRYTAWIGVLDLNVEKRF